MTLPEMENDFEYESERLLYRTITKNDLEEVRELHNNPQVLSRLTDARPVNQLEQENWFKIISSSKANYRIVIREKKSSDLVGVFRIDKTDFINQNTEIGLDVHPKFHRQGYATEVYNLMLTVLFENWNLNRVYLQTLSSNVPAIKLYLKIGMKKEGVGRQSIFRKGKFEDVTFFSLLRHEWSGKK